jgi:16S rRNA (guanine527-N7)-methyltransferase
MNLNRFIDELKILGIEINDTQLNQLERYFELLVEYNKVMNLTGITEKEEVYLKHFYDSLTIVKAIDLNTIDTLCDVGTGAGFPGMVLKILFPKLKITLIDSLNKRINFLQNVIDEIGLKDIEAIHYRIEEYALTNRDKFDVVTARAVANTSMLLEYSIPMVKVGGYFIPMKAKMDNEPDFSNAAKILNCKLVDKVEFELPIEESKRTILKFYKEKTTNTKYPRKYAEMKKRPL